MDHFDLETFKKTDRPFKTRFAKLGERRSPAIASGQGKFCSDLANQDGMNAKKLRFMINVTFSHFDCHLAPQSDGFDGACKLVYRQQKSDETWSLTQISLHNIYYRT